MKGTPFVPRSQCPDLCRVPLRPKGTRGPSLPCVLSVSHLRPWGYPGSRLVGREHIKSSPLLWQPGCVLPHGEHRAPRPCRLSSCSVTAADLVHKQQRSASLGGAPHRPGLPAGWQGAGLLGVHGLCVAPVALRILGRPVSLLVRMIPEISTKLIQDSIGTRFPINVRPFS